MAQDSIERSLVAHGVKWDSFGLDPRLTRAVAKLGWANPTLVQSHSIPLALKGKDVLAKARTGSGKTAAYALPVIQKILNDKDGIQVTPGIRALILVPTKELCDQVADVLKNLCNYCHHLVRHVFIGSDSSMETQKHRLAELPDIVVATPGRLVQHLEKGNLKISKSLQMVVVDEADLILSYGYEKDVEKIAKFLPKICQGFLASATLSSQVDSLKKLILHTPVVLKLEEEKDDQKLLQQFVVVNRNGFDKYLQLYILFKLKLIQGKTIVFVNTIEDCYKLKLFLERLSIKSAVLNSELPQNSRYHIVQDLNKGLFNILIATDEANKGEAEDDETSESEEREGEAGAKRRLENGREGQSSSEDIDESDSKMDKVEKESDSEEEQVTKRGKSSRLSSEGEKFKSLPNTNKNQKKIYKRSPSSSSSEDESHHSSSSSNTSVSDSDNDSEIIEDLDSLDESESEEEEVTQEQAKQDAIDVIGEIDEAPSISKKAIEEINKRLKVIKDLEKREAKNHENNNDSEASGSGDEEFENSMDVDVPKSSKKDKQNQDDHSSSTKNKKPKKAGRRDEEYGVSRGVDFKGIQVVINFDCPRSVKAYTHRIGRTARAGQAGIALSFCIKKDLNMVEKIKQNQKEQNNSELKPYIFQEAALESFRYRVEGVYRTVTDLAIREARYEEIRREILGSEKLQTFFEENPREMELLKHDKSLLASRINPRLKTVPDYILSQNPTSDMTPLKPVELEEEYLEHFSKRRRFAKRRLTTDPLKTFSIPAKRRKGPNDFGGPKRKKHRGVARIGPGT